MIEGQHVGAYRLVNRIGVGGMGEVWLATHSLLQRRAAIKFLHPQLAAMPEIVTRFFNEARAATAIADPGIVQIFDFGHHADGSAYLVMEMLDGETLDARLRRGPLTIDNALRIVRQVAASLGAAHARGIVHRDLKPDNIFLVRDHEVAGGERAKILDFGIAKLGEGSGLVTHISAVMGTPAFMAPEQCRGAGLVDARADVYSLGCLLFSVVTGRLPFEAQGAGELIVQHMTVPPPRASSLTTVPYALDDLLARCLDKDCSRRPASGTELALELGRVLDDVGKSTSPPGMPIASISPSAPTTLSNASASNVAVPARHRSRGAAALAVVALGGGIATMIRRGRDGRDDIAVVAVRPAAAPARDTALAPELLAPTPLPALAVADTRAAQARAQLHDALVAFRAWSPGHRGDRCPTASALGLDSDPWSRGFAITCSDQPGDQIVGASSAGPDGVLGTADDIASWTEPELARLVAGPRWTIAEQRPARPAIPISRRATVAPPRRAQPLEPIHPSQPAPPMIGSDGLIRTR